MLVLGLFGFDTNPGACLLHDGELIAFAEEERFTRFKGSHGQFPGRAIAYCLSWGRAQLEEVDRIAFGWDAGKYPYRMFGSLARQYLRHRSRGGGGRGGKGSALLKVVSNLLEHSPAHLREQIRFGLRSLGLRGEVPPIDFVPHHLCHAYSAYFCSGFDEAVVLTIDGSGEELCTQVSLGRGDRLTTGGSIPVPHSLGWYYAAFTAYFGLTPYRHEGKLMALAGLGHARAKDNPWPERLAEVLRISDGSYEVDPGYTRLGSHSWAERFTDELARWITGYDQQLSPLSPSGRSTGRLVENGYVDLAWGVQARLEEAALAVARRAAREHGINKLCIAGGVGLNCKMNGVLLHDTPFEEVFVQPAANDAGTALGAAMVVAEAAGDPIRHTMRHAGFGPEWSNAAIRELIDECGLSAEECPDVAARAAEELTAGRLVGWFQGRLELGSRALGSRSILASPAASGARERLNRKVKSREAWRPYSPSILDEERDRYLVGACASPFMTVAFPGRPERREELAPVSHVDGSIRPQTVAADAQPLYHRLMTEHRKRTGLPFILNTSFNSRGEPIVCSPRDALRCFYSTGLEVLFLGDFVLTKT